MNLLDLPMFQPDYLVMGVQDGKSALTAIQPKPPESGWLEKITAMEQLIGPRLTVFDLGESRPGLKRVLFKTRQS